MKKYSSDYRSFITHYMFGVFLLVMSFLFAIALSLLVGGISFINAFMTVLLSSGFIYQIIGGAILAACFFTILMFVLTINYIREIEIGDRLKMLPFNGKIIDLEYEDIQSVNLEQSPYKNAIITTRSGERIKLTRTVKNFDDAIAQIKARIGKTEV